MLQKENVLKNVKIVCEFVLCLPVTSASFERLFSNINEYYSSEKAQLKIYTLEATMQVYTNFNDTCVEIFQALKSKLQIIKAIHDSEKYDWYQMMIRIVKLPRRRKINFTIFKYITLYSCCSIVYTKKHTLFENFGHPKYKTIVISSTC